MTSRAAYEAYTSALDMQYAESAQMLSDYVFSFDWDVDEAAAKAQRDMVMERMRSLVDVYGTNAAVAAADLYMAAALDDGVSVRMPRLADVTTIDSIAASVRYAFSLIGQGGRRAFLAQLLSSMHRYIHDMANQTMELAAMRDGTDFRVRWARVPRGDETCAFCIMLASRGFDYLSEQSARLFNHSHEHCDCDVIPSFSDAGLEGYDPQRYLDMYIRNEVKDEYGTIQTGGTLNAMRRELYERDRERINAQKRAAYARRKAAQGQ